VMATINDWKELFRENTVTELSISILGVLGFIALSVSAFMTYTIALVIVTELFIRWEVFGQGHTEIEYLVRLTFQIPLFAVFAAVIVRTANIISGDELTYDWKQAAFIGAGVGVPLSTVTFVLTKGLVSV